MQNCFLKAQRWLLVGSVLYMYWLNTVSVTSRDSISWYACAKQDTRGQKHQ